MTLTPVKFEDGTTLTERIEKWVYVYTQSLEENYSKRYSNSSDPVKFDIEKGRKYLKVKQVDGGVHSFVDRKTGEVYKPASWRGPAKYVRFDLRVINDRQKLHDPNFTDWAGGYLYLR
tara:strand:+ start:566 stop:919 length:354 start_codon:yes stop_codon:yes gene_type:complete